MFYQNFEQSQQKLGTFLENKVYTHKYLSELCGESLVLFC